MDALNKIYKKSDSIVSRKIADEFILVPIRKNVGDLESVYKLNEVATRIWKQIDEKTKVREIKEKIVDEFEVIPEDAEEDIFRYLQQLEKIKAIREG